MTWYVVDGMDGCGKSTAGEMVAEELRARGRRVMLVSHPNPGCVWGRLENKTLHIEGKMGTLMTTALYILDVVSSLIRCRWRRKEYDDLVFIRYSMAVTYLPERIVPMGYKVITHVLPTPDVKMLIDVDAKTAMQRIEARSEDREAFEKEEKLASIRKKMQLVTSDGWDIVDNTKGLDNTKSQIVEIINRECPR